MKYFKKSVTPLFILLAGLSFLTVGCSNDTTDTVPSITTTADDGSTSVVDETLDDVLSTLPLGDLSEDEVVGLLFMREEEKLAHDVYVYLYAEWGATVFDKISSSEQTHTDAMLTLLDRYGIADPVGDNAEGIFVDPSLQGLYDALIVLGAPSLVEALFVGAEIEEIDILDIQKYIDKVEGNQDIVIVYENLMKGSRNHLRSFVKNLANQDVVYEPKHLTQEAYDAIINAPMETN